MGNGTTGPTGPWYQRWSGDRAVRRRALALASLLALAAVLLFLPKVQPASSTASAPVASQIAYLPGQTPMNARYASGTTVGGVRCGPNVRQVSWSAYAPACQPAWHGDNGGATTPGVTGSTITVSYRNTAAAILKEIYALIPPDVTGTNAEFVQTIQAYINVFNKEFELYGRHVVLAPFDGEGDTISEDTGSGGPQAQADAVTAATTLHAFADMSLASSTSIYAQDLAAQKVIAFGTYTQDAQYYAQNAPYAYTTGPNCTKSAVGVAALFGRQLKGLPAQFAKGGLQTQARKLGIIYPSTQAACEQAIVKDLATYGVTPAAAAGMGFSFAQLQSDSDIALAQMKQAGVTTIICVSCDQVTPRYYFASATADHYYPEWYVQPVESENASDGETSIRLLPADQRQDIITSGVPDTAPSQAEAVEAFKLGNTVPGAKIVPEFQLVYGSMLLFFSALQNAGPNLTPANFQAAVTAIPQSSPGGELGGWNGKDGPYDPASSFQVLKWDNAATSPADGQRGTWATCNSGNVYPFDTAGSLLPELTPLACQVTALAPSQLGQVPSS